MPAGQVEQLLLEEHRLEDLCGSVGDARVLAGGVEAQAANLDVLERGLAHLGPDSLGDVPAPALALLHGHYGKSFALRELWAEHHYGQHLLPLLHLHLLVQ